jgi:hypothetical protein
MNDPWNRFFLPPSVAPFGADVGVASMPSIPSGGILGNLGHNMSQPWTEDRPELMPPNTPDIVAEYPWLYRSSLQTPDPATLNFLAAWDRSYSAPLLPSAWLSTSPRQRRTAIGTNGPSYPAPPAPDFSSAPAFPGQPQTFSAGADGGRRSNSSMNLPDRDGAGDFMPPMGYLNANYGGDAPPQSRMNTRRMPGGDSSPFSASPTPTWDSAQSPIIPGGAEPFLEQPSRSPGNASVNKTDPSRSAGTEGPAEILSDETPDNQWIPGADYAADGHHYFPRANYKGTKAIQRKDPMSPETKRAFDEAKTGRLYVRSIDGRRHEFDVFHRQYNDATDEILDAFMKENNIAKRSHLTPDHVPAVLKAIEESQDPRILTYRNFIRMLRMFPWLRAGGRGIE